MYICIHIYIYIYREREREIHITYTECFPGRKGERWIGRGCWPSLLLRSPQQPHSHSWARTSAVSHPPFLLIPPFRHTAVYGKLEMGTEGVKAGAEEP